MKSLRENIKYWGKLYGVEHLAFLTLTFEENLTCPKEAQRRFNNFSRQFSRIGGCKWMYKAIEPQERGALHYHLVVKVDSDLKPEQVDWEAYRNMNNERKIKNWGKMYKYQRQFTASVTDEVRDMWQLLRRICKGSGMGRSEFLPIRSSTSIGSYVGKYLNKCFASDANGSWEKGARRFAYARWVPQIHGRQFSWLQTGKTAPEQMTWREKLTVWAHGVGVQFDDYEDLQAKYGRQWALTQREAINYYGVLWEGKGLRFGHARPAQYPTGRAGNPLAYMGSDKSLDDPFSVSEGELWTQWLGQPKKQSVEWERWQKWKSAQEHKARFSYLYE